MIQRNDLFFVFGPQFRVVLATLLPVVAYLSPLPNDCSDIYKAGSGQDGVYTIYPAGPTSALQVYCDMSRDDTESPEKWTVRLAHHKNLCSILLLLSDSFNPLSSLEKGNSAENRWHCELLPKMGTLQDWIWQC